MTGPLTAAPAAELPAWAGQRQLTYRFTLLEAATLRPLQTVSPMIEANPTLSHDTTGSLYKRTVDLSFGRADSEVIDPRAHRIKIEMLVDGQVWPLGRYAFTAPTRQRFRRGNLLDAQLADEFVVLDTELERPFKALPGIRTSQIFEPGPSTADAIRLLLAELPITAVIEDSVIELENTWEAGTVKAKVLHDLALLGGYLPPWFDHTGRLRLRLDFDPATTVPTINLDSTGRVIADSVAESDDLLDAPNRVVVISNGVTADTEPVYGTYDVPPSAPNSAERLGFVKTKTYDAQLTSQHQADAVAESVGRRVTPLEYVELSTAPDPRHESYDVVRWAGGNWLETRWSLPLSPGGAMRHTLRRAYGG